ncbi:MAG TPA: hypothetical protein VHU80_00605, partial [Polyangiaceae bacterium]|nr:hypothetical protein [Polyangiaceae bacterium]
MSLETSAPGARPPAAQVGASRERLRALMRGCSEAELRMLGAIALEQTLGKNVLSKLSGGAGAKLDIFLARAVDERLLVPDRAAPAILFAAATAEEPWFSVSPEYEQLLLRDLHARHALRDVALALRDLLGARSIGDVTLALQDGDLERFTRALAVRRLPRKAPPRSAAEWLRVTVCEPFDAAWFTGVFGPSATRVATRVLEDGLEAPGECDALVAWTRTQSTRLDGDDERVALASVLQQHALLRGTGEARAADVVGLPRETALGLEAAGRFARGELGAAQRLLDELLAKVSARRRATSPRCSAVTPLLALLLAARNETDATAEA